MSDRKKRIVLIGATSSIAEHCARLWVLDHPCDLVLVGRDMTRMTLIATDLAVRSPASTIACQVADFVQPTGIAACVAEILAKGVPDLVLIAHGSLPDQLVCQSSLEAAHEAMMINALSPVLFAEAFAGAMEKANKGVLAVIGSVAGDRGRKSNYVYGAAKGLVSRYVQGLQHRLAKSQVRVVLIKPGPTDTPMTAHLKQKGTPLAPVEDVAKTIVDGIKSGKSEIYAPAKWALIMLIIQHLPRFVFHKLEI